MLSCAAEICNELQCQKHFKSRLQLEIKPVQTAFHQKRTMLLDLKTLFQLPFVVLELVLNYKTE